MPTDDAELAPGGGKPQGLSEIKEILKRNQDIMLKLQEELDVSVAECSGSGARGSVGSVPAALLYVVHPWLDGCAVYMFVHTCGRCKQ
jgi:hypothetical protein